MDDDHDRDGTQIYYKDWGTGTARRLQPRLAAQRGCLRGPDVLPGLTRLPLHRHDRRGHGPLEPALEWHDLNT